ncbi:MAG: DUF333 domain-containing protein [Candidatus Micrarchaeota archaeon]
MKKLLIAVGLMTLLLFGCVQEQPPVDGPGPTMTCDEHCKQQPHAQCVGTWDNSGDYPVCICNYICEQEEPEPPAQLPNPAAVNCDDKGYSYEIRDETGYCSHGTKECEEWALYRMECCLADADCSGMECGGRVGASCVKNSCACPDTVDLIPPVATGKTIRQLLDDSLADINDEFYAEIESGTFNTTSYKWLHTAEDEPGSITIGDAGVQGDILFSNQEMEGVVAFGMKSFVQTDGVHKEARGIAIFDGGAPLLSAAYSDGGSFSISYRAPTPDLRFSDCTVTELERFTQLEHDNRVLDLFHFTCDDVEAVED